MEIIKKKKNHQAAVEDYHNVLAHQVINICSWIIENNRQQHKNAKFVMDYGFMSIQYNEIETLFLNAIFVDVSMIIIIIILEIMNDEHCASLLF